MRKIVLVLSMIFLTNILFAGDLCINIKNPSNQLFEDFAKELKEFAKKHYKIENFQIDKNNRIIKGERVFKVKRRRKNNMLIGIPVDNFRKKPKWKKERIEISGKFKNNSVCISVNLEAYNKRTRKWHKLKSDYLLEEHMAVFIISNSLRGKTLWSIGNLILSDNGVNKRVLNLTKFVVDGANIYIDLSSGMKSVNFNLKQGDKTLVFKVLMVGDVKDPATALKVFNSHFLDFNPVKKTPKIYDFYWAYAKHGEIMDGMHKLQLITALGYPSKIVKKNANSEVFVYIFDEKTYKYTIVNNELTLEE